MQNISATSSRPIDEVAVHNAVDADIDRFSDVMITDGTLLRLHEFLSDEFQPRHEEEVGEKLHLLHNATDQTIERLDVIDENDGYFVSRLKKNINPVITEELREWRSRAISLEDEQIQVVTDLLQQYIVVEVEAEFKWGEYERTRSLDAKRFRVRHPRRGRRRLPSVHHESAERGVSPSGSSNAVSVSMGGRNAVP